MPLFLAFHSFCFVCFEEQNLHFAPYCLSSLVAHPLFFAPNNPLLAPKKPLFNDNFALFSHVFIVRKVFVYTIAVYFYAFHLAFSGILHCILHHFTLRFAPKRTAFSGIFALHFAAKRTLFCWKWPKNWYKQHSFKINIHFACMYNYTFFASKQTFARIDFLRQVGDWWIKKALRMLNFLLKTRQKKNDYPIYKCRGNGTENTYTYKRQGGRL